MDGTPTAHHGRVTESPPDSALARRRAGSRTAPAGRLHRGGHRRPTARGAGRPAGPPRSARASTPRPSGSSRCPTTRSWSPRPGRCSPRPVDLVVATTGVGFRGWLEAAEAWDLPLREHLRPARVLARGPEGPRRHPRRRAWWTPGRRRRRARREVLTHLLSGAEGPLAGPADRRPAARRSAAGAGERAARRPAPRCSGAGLPVGAAGGHRPAAPAGRRRSRPAAWTRSPSPAPRRRPACCRWPPRRAVRAAVVGAFADARAAGLRRPGDRRAAGERRHPRPCSPSAPGWARWPARWSPGCPQRDPVLRAGRAHAAGAGPRRRARRPAGGAGARARWRCCARWPAVPAWSCPGPTCCGELSGGGDEHAVEMAVTRLRAALGAPVVETVVKRGYRLAVYWSAIRRRNADRSTPLTCRASGRRGRR